LPIALYLDAIQPLFVAEEKADYPFNLPIWRGLSSLEFTTPVTFLVGDNGAGKSTLLEAIAVQFKLSALTQAGVDSHPLMDGTRELAKKMRFVRRPGNRSSNQRGGFFFRADDVTGFVQQLSETVKDHKAMEQHFDETLDGYGKMLATGAVRQQHNAITERYGNDPFARSHGELFLTLLQSRLENPGLCLLDEPETPLSPTNQIALLAMLLEAAKRGSQVIAATHSPILMALPGARIYDFDQRPPAPIAWEDVEHVAITKSFLNNPDKFLRHL
jgi:predicted ATPase